MSDYGRHDYDTRSRVRDRGGDRGRDYERAGSRGRETSTRGSIFGSDWASPDRDRDYGRDRWDEGRSASSRGRYDDDRWGASRGYGSDDYRDGIAIDETSRLIASNKVEGTAVYGRDGERLGSIYNFMVDKYSGRVDYAVMSYGGFLGMGARYYPLPWKILSYDVREGGYRVDLTARDLERAPSFGRDDEPSFNRDYGERVYGWYGLYY